jgi:transcriptional regulator with XRE-family HTH domain
MRDSELAAIIGNNIRKARMHKKLSQDELAQKAGIDRSYMGRIERGEINVTLEKIYRISYALNMPLQSIIDINNQ